MPGAEFHTNDVAVKVNGQPLSAAVQAAVAQVAVDETLHAPAQCTLMLHDPDGGVVTAAGAALGRPLEVAISQGGTGQTPLFAGEVVALEAEFDGGGSFAVVRAMDKSHRLLRGRKTRTFLQVSYDDVVRTVAQETGLTAQVDATGVVHPYILQANRTDWELLTELAAEIGYDLTVAGTALRFKRPAVTTAAPTAGDVDQPAQARQLVKGVNLLAVHAALRATDQVSTVEVRGWDPVRKQAVVATAATGSATGSTAGVAPSAAATAFSSRPQLVSTGVPYRTQAAAQRAATGLAHQQTSAFAELTGTAVGDPELRAGTAVSLGGVGAPFDGKYVLTTVRHTSDPDEGYTTEFTVVGGQDRSLLALGGGAAGTPGGGRASAQYGVVTGIVTNNKDPESRFRVKVKFPWLSDAEESEWAPVAQAMVGNAYGAALLPEVNDEVLVAFDHGDVRAPVVLGGLYNGIDKPAETSAVVVKNGKVVSRRLETRTKQRMVFSDDQGTKQGLSLHTGDDQQVVTLDQTGGSVTVTGKKIVIKSSAQTVEITAAQDVKVKAGAGMTLEATGALELKGSTVKIQGQASAELAASGPTTVKGAVVKIN